MTFREAGAGLARRIQRGLALLPEPHGVGRATPGDFHFRPGLILVQGQLVERAATASGSLRDVIGRVARIMLVVGIDQLQSIAVIVDSAK